jgi:hypothetical protein
MRVGVFNTEQVREAIYAAMGPDRQEWGADELWPWVSASLSVSDEQLTLAVAATRLGIAHATLRWQIKNGKLRARKVGPIWTVSEREVERYARENRR